MPKLPLVLVAGFIHRVYMFAGDDEDMRRSLRAEVVKRHANIVLKDFWRRYTAIGDLAEYTIFGAHIGDYLAASLACSSVTLSVIRSISAPSERNLRTIVS